MTRLKVLVCVAFDHRAPLEGLDQFKRCVLRCSFVESAMEVTGTFDLVVQGSCASLTEYTENMELIRPQLANYVSRIDTNFISKMVEVGTGEDTETSIWLPCEGGRKSVAARLIDKVVAEGDYMRVHVGNWSCLVHVTMQRLFQKLGHAAFIKLHRSSLVRVGFIERVVHEDHRWLARLRDGTSVTVARSHVHNILHLMTAESSTQHATPTLQSRPNDGARPIEEKTKMLIG